MSKLNIIIIFILFISVLNADYTNLLSQIADKYENAATFEANITQINHFHQIDHSLKSEGNIYINNGINVIEFITPSFQFIKLERNTLTIYMSEFNTAIIKNSLDNNISAILQFPKLLTNDLVFDQKDNEFLIFDYTKNFDGINDIKLYIDEANLLINTIYYYDEMNNLININLNNQKFNQTLSKDINDFVIPEGVVIERL